VTDSTVLDFLQPFASQNDGACLTCGVRRERWNLVLFAVINFRQHFEQVSISTRIAVLSAYAVCFDFSLDIDDLHLKTYKVFKCQYIVGLVTV